MASHFSRPKYRRFGPNRASCIRDIGGFVSYIGNIGLPGLDLAYLGTTGLGTGPTMA